MQHIRTWLVVAVVGVLLAVPASAMAQSSQAGSWGEPFAEPTINGEETDEVCVDEPKGDEPEHDGTTKTCKPTATSLAVLGAGDVVYWNGLEDTEEVENGIALEYGEISTQDQVRRLDLANRTWTPSDPDEGEEVGDEPRELIPGTASTETYNDDVLFCAALTHTADGQVMAVGGTTYYGEPDLPGRYGVVELQGSNETRLYDPATNSWERSGDMHHGRWYPSVVPLADGQQFVAGGVGKLIKPVYDDTDPEDSGRNVPQTETWDPETGEWTENGEAGERSLPLYPRLHLLPGGDVYYNAAGQVFNPSGQAYDEALWNLAAAYDPDTQSWTDLGLAGAGTMAPGFRGSTTSVMLPLRPDEDGEYTSASFLQAGGILGTTPGTYFAIPFSRIDTVDTDTMTLSSADTGSLATPRWYGQSVLLPTGEVLMVNGATADEVVGPGSAMPVLTPELWDPATGEWTQMADQSEARTYHNSAALLPDGTVLTGGHDPISTLYGSNMTLVPGVTSPQETRNPTFEIFSPPYLFRGERPEVVAAPTSLIPGQQDTVAIGLDIPADEVESVMLMRKTAITHLVDGGQRAVELQITQRAGNSVQVAVPPDASVAPAGPYLLFVNRSTDEGPVPSEGVEVTVQQGALPGSTGAQGTAGAALDTVDAETAVAAATAPATAGTAAAATAAGAADATTEVAGPPVGAVPTDPHLAYHETAELMVASGLATHDELHDFGLAAAHELPGRTTDLALVATGLLLATLEAVRRRVKAT